ncbi:hypothetical protein [Virgibacillus halodenitrificans]|uniref:hypothetical protein n=1 Tax=Virgibacillus halodenitrificans TaxID=1482 RepID=UPI000EF44646|nr:hypothetical protein [Virgibacillus halodenitrificans]
MTEPVKSGSINMDENLNDKFIEMINTKIIVEVLNENVKTLLISCDELDLKLQDGIMPYLTLGDIAEQLEKRFMEPIIIYVWVELGLNGYIYRYGGPDRYWMEHGKTKGFA